ncbi:methionine synthase [Thermogladius sp. 4427co]|uniref:methionine synthase n=1 Tax=Thermogladius sp. 4427co TaxID=3450718 RepID=UPI003F79DBC2
MRTSHVGSFPLEYSIENIRRIAHDLRMIGIDVPPYPQLRNFVDIYMEYLIREGVVGKKNENYYAEKPMENRIMEFNDKIPEAEFFAEHARSLGVRDLRAPVTGPFTLASKVYLRESGGLEATGVSSKPVVEFFAYYVNSILRYMEKTGYSYLFIDEPVLGVLVGSRRILFGWSEEELIDIVSTSFKGLGGVHGIHVCGRISPRLVEILSSNPYIQILNFEFHDTPENIDVISSRILKDKVLAPGVASSKKPVIEEVNEILSLLKQVYDRVGGRIDLVSADCGFGGLASPSGSREEAYSIAIQKLANIKKAVELLSNTRG